MLAPFVPYIGGFGLLIAVLGITYSVVKKKYAFLPTYALLFLASLFFTLAALPQNAGDWGAIFYILFGMFFLIAAFIALIVVAIIRLLKDDKIEQIK